MDVAFLILRLVVGLTLAAHGAQKVFGWFQGSRIEGFAAGLVRMGIKPARLWAWVAGLSELVGGLLIALGLLWPAGPAVAVGAMLVAIITVHWAKGFFNSKGGIEFPLVILAACVALALAGPGAYAVDRLLGFRLPEPQAALIALVLVVLGAVGSLATRWLPESLFARPELG
jgi:putative oxidoreductase